MIRRIQALNYRCLRYVDVELDSFHILVGPNASGKSTLLDVIGFLSDLVRDGLEEAVEKRTHNFQDLVWDRPRQDSGFELAVEFDIPPDAGGGEHGQMDYQRLRYEILIREDDEAGLCIGRERAMLIPKTRRRPRHRKTIYFPESLSSPKTIFRRLQSREFPVFRRIGGGWTKFGQEEATGLQAAPRSKNLGPYKSALGHLVELREIPGLEEFFGVEEFMTSWLIGRNFSRGIKSLFLDSQKIRQPSPPHLRRRKFSTDGSNLPWLVAELQWKHKHDYAEWLLHVQTMLPDLQGIRVMEREEDRKAYLMLKYKTGVEIPSWMASDGTLRFLAITLIPYLLYADQIYLLEEPENGIHPLALDAIYDSLTSAYDSQVFVATHSPAFLKLAEPSEVLCFAKDRQGATDVIRGDRHPILIDWQGVVDIEALFATGIIS